MHLLFFHSICQNSHNFHSRILSYQQLWILEENLCDLAEEETIDGKSKVA